MNASIMVRRVFDRQNLPLLVALCLVMCAALLKPIPLKQNVFTFQIGFDISQSMNVADIMLEGMPVTRLDYAKAIAASLVQQLPCGSSVGWSVFTGRRTLTLITPLGVCEHYSGLMASLAEIDGSMRWSNSSSIGKGIHQIMRAASEFDEPTDVIFMTDGQEAPPLEPGQRGVPATEKFGIKGLLAGVGGDVPAPIPKTDPNGIQTGFWSAAEVVQRLPSSFSTVGEELSRRDDERLLSLSRLTQLDYLILDSGKALINQAELSELGQQRSTPTDIRWIPASIALLLLLWSFWPWHSSSLSYARSGRH